MNETAARLRAQKAYSTDPDYLERMALAEEARAGRASDEEAESLTQDQEEGEPPLVR